MPTTPLLLAGQAPAALLLDGVRQAVARLARAPHLLVVRAGEEPASAQYVRSIRRAAASAGVQVTLRDLPPQATFEEFCDAVARGAADPAVDAVQIQKPIPGGRHTSEVMERVPPAKDVEGIHPENIGLLVLGRPRFVPCTPAAVLRLLDHWKLEVRGKRAVVLGRSDIVGKPLASLLLARHATVTVCHTATADLADEVARAELLVAAAGSPELVRADWVREGAIVVDVGHHVLADGRCVGDVEAGAAARAAAITPVPGGVGPITVAELLSNVVAAAPRD